jgi:hypothetical protein
LRLDDVHGIVARALAVESSTWPARTHGNAGLAFLLAAVRVSGLTPGLYAVGPAAACRALTGARPLAGLRDKYADAPALLFVCGDLHYGAGTVPGYGSVLVRAGSLGYASWLAAIASGIAGTVFGGTCNEVSRAAQKADPRLSHLFTVALGYPSRGWPGRR